VRLSAAQVELKLEHTRLTSKADSSGTTSLCSVQVELKVEAIHVISRAAALPFEVIDASRGDEELAAAVAKGELLVTVSRDTRLDSRPVDLRTPANQAVFQIQSGVCQARP
jgi:aspartyl-tRNA synthetase